MATVYLGLGSNVGKPESQIRDAVRRLGELGTIVTVSPLYKTEPIGYTNQPWILNCVVKLDTTLYPDELLEATQAIELDMKRIRLIKNGPRTIDIDVLLYDDLVLDTEHLTIPHPRMHERLFVMTPLKDIEPDILHPILNQRVIDIEKSLPRDKGIMLHTAE